MNYDSVTRELAHSLDQRCQQTLNIVVMDGVPATGKSSLALAVADVLSESNRDVVCVENDWFIARSIRNPLAIAAGLALAVSPLSKGDIETRLLARFLDQRRLAAFQDELVRARTVLESADEVVLHPDGAYWNLHQPKPWHEDPAAAGLRVRRGSIVLIEGTLTAATHAPRFPELISVLVRVDPSVARSRFRDRNADPKRRRNAAFSALAMTTLPFKIASELLERQSYDVEVDLTSLTAPRLQTGLRPAIMGS